MNWQKTIKKSVSYTGMGLHLGKEVKVTLESAPFDQGVVFVREDLPGTSGIKATVSKVVSNDRGTTIGNGEVKITTVEHILAALSGMGVDNITIKMNGEEFPAGDGSALIWAKLIQRAEIVSQNVPRKFFEVKKPFWIKENGRQLIVLPHKEFKITYMVDFPKTPLKSQLAEFTIDKDTFLEEIAPSRTFGFMKEVEY